MTIGDARGERIAFEEIVTERGLTRFVARDLDARCRAILMKS